MAEDLLDASASDRVMKEIEELIASLHPLDRSTYRAQFFSMFSENLSDLFVIKLDLTPTVGACHIAGATLDPSQRLLDWVATVRARKLDKDVE